MDLRAFSVGRVCGFLAGFRILTFLQDFESKNDKHVCEKHVRKDLEETNVHETPTQCFIRI